MKQRYGYLFIILFGIISVLVFSSCKQNWPQFRGPESNMLSAAKSLPEEWGNDINIAWTYKMDGLGWSSPIVWGNKVFIASTFPVKINPVPERGPMEGPPHEGEEPQPDHMPQPGQGPRMGPPPEPVDTTYLQEIYRWQVTCIDLNTGKELWKQTAYEGVPKISKQPGNTYASETPVTDGKRIYAYFGPVGLFCYDISGELLWKKDLGTYKTQAGWGTGSSPVLFKDILYVQVDNEENSFVVALNAASGEEKWRVQREEKTNYSSPVIWKNKMRTELVTTGKTARSYDPATGKLLWELKIGGEQTVPSPVGDQEMIYIGNSGGREIRGFLFAVRAGAEGDITPKEGEMSNKWIAWTYPEAAMGNASPLLYNGKIYIISSRGGEILCLNSINGEVVYNGRVPGIAGIWASPWVYNNRIWFFDEKGVTISLKADDKFEYASDNRLDDKFWASVAITNNAYIFKGVEKLYCVKK